MRKAKGDPMAFCIAVISILMLMGLGMFLLFTTATTIVLKGAIMTCFIGAGVLIGILW